MKTIIAILAAVTVLVASAMADKNYGYSDSEDSFGFVITQEPHFPVSLQSAGINEGSASFLVVVDINGELEDYLVIEASHLGFARTVEAAMKHWRFHPPVVNGEPVRLAQTFTVNFSSSGTVISSTGPSMMMDLVLNRFNLGSNAVRIHSGKELDDFLEPIHIKKPQVHNDYLNSEEIIEFTIDFFVDKKGNVRIPLLRTENPKLDDRLVHAAQIAMTDWKFIPPTVKGKAVVVRVAQPFKFHRTSNSLSKNSGSSN